MKLDIIKEYSNYFFFNSQVRGPIRAVAASLHHSHHNVGSEPGLKSIPQFTAMPDP